MRASGRRFQKVAALLAVALSALGLTALPVPPARAAAGFAFTRLAGADRYATAAAVAVASFPLGAATVVVATGETFPDALAGSFLAGAHGAPILLVPRTAPVPAATLAALATLGARRVILLGGPDAIGPDIQQALVATGLLSVTRLAGADRYETMKAIVTDPSTGVGGVDSIRTAIVASGENFPDALALGPVAWALGLPVILTTPGSLSPRAAEALTQLRIGQVIIAGGPLAISPATEATIAALGIGTLVRFAGVDRSDTSRLAADYAIDNFGFKRDHFNVASGGNFPDALAGGPHGGAEDPTVNLITNSSNDPGQVVDFAAASANLLRSGHAFGGPAALPDATLATITTAGVGPARPGGGGGLTLSPPTIAGVLPAAGPTAGGTAFTISGTDLFLATAVDFCGTAVTGFTTAGPFAGGPTGVTTTVSGVTPPGPAGACLVTVTTPGGTATTTFTYVAPPTIAIAPVAGPLAGGTPFTITGTNLALASAVDFCGTAAAGFITLPAGTTVTGTTPAKPAGACLVTVTTPGGTATTTFTYVAPPTIAIAPVAGPLAGGTPFTITGTNLALTSAVDFC
ncbi:MAG: cell wall-binding repeat-containing protein, partial [Acidimicrobiales bacterium]